MMIGKKKYLGHMLISTAMLAVSLSVCAQTDEEHVGRSAAAQILGSAPLLSSAAVQQYVNLLGSAVSQYSSQSYNWHFGVLKSETVNAFGMPGGYVLLSAGLLKILETEDELAFVIAHEIAHVTKRHHYQIVQRQRLAAQASKELQAVVQNTDVSKLSLASGEIYARGLDKSAEFESDRLGVQMMAQAGYDPSAAIGVLEKLQRFKGNDPRTELLFSTHPSPVERLDALLLSGIENLPKNFTKSNANRQLRFKKMMESI